MKNSLLREWMGPQVWHKKPKTRVKSYCATVTDRKCQSEQAEG